MKLLIVTQAIDVNDPVLGFFGRWVEEFAKHVESIEVICLKEGKHALPKNVHVHSLGKEHGAANRAVYAWRFLSLAWRLRGDYDAVFVHMNQEYVLIAGWLWKLVNKRVYLWRNHYAGSMLTDVAAAFCTKVFCTSKHSYTAKYKKTVIMPVGVDTERFYPDARIARVPRSILFLSRMSPSKRPEMLLDALATLAQSGTDFTTTLVGSPLPQDEAFYEGLKEKVRSLSLAAKITFLTGVPHSETPDLYRAHEIFVNTSPSGMLDKTLFEAAASDCIVLASSKDIRDVLDEEAYFNTVQELADKLEAFLQEKERSEVSREKLEKLSEKHSLAHLVSELMCAMRPRRAVLFQNGSIGDFLMFVHLSELLMKSDQFSDVIIVVPRNAVFLRDLIKAYHYISVLDVSTGRWKAFSTLQNGIKTVLIHSTIGRIPLRVKFLAWLLTRGRGRELIGFQDAGSFCWLYSKTLSYDTNKPYLKTVHDLAHAAGVLGTDNTPPRLQFEGSQEVLAAYGLIGKTYIVFHPGASNPKRMFTIEDAAEFVHFVLKKFPTVQVVLSGGSKESNYIHEIARKSGEEGVVMAIGTQAEDVTMLIQHAKLFVGTDTGTTHLACFLGTRVIEVAHNATANWLAFYAPHATVLYRLKGENAVHTGQDYLRKHAGGILRSFDSIPVTAVCETVENVLQESSVASDISAPR